MGTLSDLHARRSVLSAISPASPARITGTSNQLDLVSYIEIAYEAGVSRQAVTNWRTRHPDFPVPVAELKIGPVWLWADIREWLIKTGRLEK